MTSLPTFTLTADTARNESFSTDLSAYLMAASWKLGFANGGDPLCADSTAQFMMRNDGQLFSPESASAISGLTRGCKIKLQTTYAATTRTMTILRIRNIAPAGGTRGPRASIINCTGFIDATIDAEAHAAIQEGKTADQVIAALLDSSNAYPPGLGAVWRLGVPGYSKLGISATLAASTDYLTAETGVTTFNYIGDQWGDNASLFGALRDTVGREKGYLFVNRAGTLVFWNRGHFIADTVTDQTFSGTMRGLSYSYGNDVINDVTVVASPRSVGAAPEMLARLDMATLVSANSSLAVTYMFTDITGGGANIAGRALIVPLPTTDFSANDAADGSGTDRTASVTAAITMTDATQCEVTYSNAYAGNVYILARAQVRGTAIRSYADVNIRVKDSTSIGLFDTHKLRYGYSADNVSDATAIANALLSERRAPHGAIKSLILSARHDDTLMTAALVRTIGDRVVITETQTGVSAPYFIVSENHTLGRDKNYLVTWGLMPADPTGYWQLGFSQLGVNTTLAPL